MESVTTYYQETNHKESQQNQLQPTSGQPLLFSSQPNQSSTKNTTSQTTNTTTTTALKAETFTPLASSSSSKHQNFYQEKCNLLEYHIQEAILVNKALRSEVKQYRDKIDFEKRLRKFLLNRAKSVES